MKKPAIPLPNDASPAQDRFNRNIKEVLEILQGLRRSRIAPLPVDATLDDVIAKVNELVDLLQ